MTTIMKEAQTCVVCGTRAEYQFVRSVSQSGVPDLDTRPADIAGETAPLWIQRCPTCGYCGPTVAWGPAQAAEVVKSPVYTAQLDSPAYPPVANRCLCWSLVLEAARAYPVAGWAAVYAAWICDDARGAGEAADACRARAVSLFQLAQAQGVAIAHETGFDEVILADLLRRSGRFEEASATAEMGLRKTHDELMQQLLSYEQALALAKDRARHTVDDAATLNC